MIQWSLFSHIEWLMTIASWLHESDPHQWTSSTMDNHICNRPYILEWDPLTSAGSFSHERHLGYQSTIRWTNIHHLDSVTHGIQSPWHVASNWHDLWSLETYHSDFQKLQIHLTHGIMLGIHVAYYQTTISPHALTGIRSFVNLHCILIMQIQSSPLISFTSGRLDLHLYHFQGTYINLDCKDIAWVNVDHISIYLNGQYQLSTIPMEPKSILHIQMCFESKNHWANSMSPWVGSTGLHFDHEEMINIIHLFYLWMVGFNFIT